MKKRIMHIQDATGDTRVDLDTQTDLAEQLFNEAIKNGKMVYGSIDGENVNLVDFSETEEAAKVVVIPRYIGG